MAQVMSLKEAERRAFRLGHSDGLWDVFLGCFFLIFVGAPYLSDYVGDFWSSAVFLPLWGLAFVVLSLVRRRVVTPRLGVARFGRRRQARLKAFSFVMLGVNSVLLILGLLAAAGVFGIRGSVAPLAFGLVLLAAFSFAGYTLDFGRLYFYGLLAAALPWVGEWLYARELVPHHGWPVAFGALAGVMILTGVILFIRLLRRNPLPTHEPPPEEEGRRGA